MAEVVYKRRFGDRKEGRQLRSLSPFYKFTPYIMGKKNDACNFFSDSLEISACEDWFHEKRRSGWKGMGMLHLFIAAYVRTIAEAAKDRLLADREVEEVRELFPRVGITVVQDETFYVEPKKEEV